MPKPRPCFQGLQGTNRWHERLSLGGRSKKQTSRQQRHPGNDEHAMNCEICKVIRKLGLRKSAHKLWLCTAKQMPRRRKRVAMSNSRLVTTS